MKPNIPISSLMHSGGDAQTSDRRSERNSEAREMKAPLGFWAAKRRERPAPPAPETGSADFQTSIKPVARRRSRLAFTLVELMVTVAVFLVVFVGVMVGLQIFSLRVYTLSATKLTATADARKTLNGLRSEIRSAKLLYVGNYTNSSFARIPNGQPQTGNALAIYSADTNGQASLIPTVFYLNSDDNRIYSVSNSATLVMANYVTNYYVFTAENYQAVTMNNYDNNPVIRVTMEFYQWQYPIGFIGTNALNAYNHYRLQTRIFRRLKE